MVKIEKATYKNLLDKVSNLIEEARRKTVRYINTVITQTYWEIGRLIVEEEQRGMARAEYGEELVKRIIKGPYKKIWQGIYHVKPLEYASILLNLPKTLRTA
ncbi:hypothetical protein DMNBHIDG_02947 [Candidatus Methanoperedenaceae archaeon GB37]|nr:hypothetical protein DMNBHIDG_02947 [Candidatus Methanoperedenaceae archaeon GB37]